MAENPTTENIRKMHGVVGMLIDELLDESNKPDCEEFFMKTTAIAEAHDILLAELKVVYKSYYADLLHKYDELKKKFGGGQ